MKPKGFHLDTDQIEITHEYKYLGIDFYSHDYFESSSKRWGITSMRALMGTLRDETVVNAHLFKALVLPTSTYGTEIWEVDLKNSH